MQTLTYHRQGLPPHRTTICQKNIFNPLQVKVILIPIETYELLDYLMITELRMNPSALA